MCFDRTMRTWIPLQKRYAVLDLVFRNEIDHHRWQSLKRSRNVVLERTNPESWITFVRYMAAAFIVKRSLELFRRLIDGHAFPEGKAFHDARSLITLGEQLVYHHESRATERRAARSKIKTFKDNSRSTGWRQAQDSCTTIAKLLPIKSGSSRFGLERW